MPAAAKFTLLEFGSSTCCNWHLDGIRVSALHAAWGVFMKFLFVCKKHADGQHITTITANSSGMLCIGMLHTQWISACQLAGSC